MSTAALLWTSMRRLLSMFSEAAICASQVRRREVDPAATIAEAEAWGDYLNETQGLESMRYEEVESWAWARLGRRLLELERERTREKVAA
jgi:hypothetical protein